MRRSQSAGLVVLVMSLVFAIMIATHPERTRLLTTRKTGSLAVLTPLYQ